MKLIDLRATETSPSSVFLTRAEYRKLYPHIMGNRINYIFKYDQPKKVNDGEAKILKKKYSHIITWTEKIDIGMTERHQELDKVKYTDLKKIAGKLGYPFIETTIKREALINKIVAKEVEILKEKEGK